MNNHAANTKMITKLVFRLLPIQVLLSAVGSVNGIVSSFFASNFVGIDAMSAVGQFAPINMLITSISTILVGGSVILCGKHLGKNEQDMMQNVFSLNLMLSLLISGAFMAIYIVSGLFDLSRVLVKDTAVRAIFNRYLLGQAVGIIPLMLGNSMAAFLSLENKGKKTLIASLVYILVNLLLNYLFVQLLHL